MQPRFDNLQVGDAIPAPHWIGVALGVVLLALQWRGPAVTAAAR